MSAPDRSAASRYERKWCDTERTHPEHIWSRLSNDAPFYWCPGTKPFASVRPPEQPPICAVTVSSSWHEPVACAFPPDHDGPHSWASIPALPRGGRMTKREAGVRLAIIAGEILLTLDEDEDAPTWPAELSAIADALNPGGAT